MYQKHLCAMLYARNSLLFGERAQRKEACSFVRHFRFSSSECPFPSLSALGHIVFRGDSRTKVGRTRPRFLRAIDSQIGSASFNDYLAINVINCLTFVIKLKCLPHPGVCDVLYPLQFLFIIRWHTCSKTPFTQLVTQSHTPTWQSPKVFSEAASFLLCSTSLNPRWASKCAFTRCDKNMRPCDVRQNRTM